MVAQVVGPDLVRSLREAEDNLDTRVSRCEIPHV